VYPLTFLLQLTLNFTQNDRRHTPFLANVEWSFWTKVCKADWLQTGPKCRLCHIGDTLEDLNPDKVTFLVLSSLQNVVRGATGSALLQLTGDPTFIAKRAKMFFEVLDVAKKERAVAYRFWRTHANLLNDIDELNQCKSTMRLTKDGEDLTALSKEQLNAVVQPIDTAARFHHYAAKQVMAVGALSRDKGALQYLQNLGVKERQRRVEASETDDEAQTCPICLFGFDTERAVLRCGHVVHFTPCLEQLRSRSNGPVLYCPLRCTTRTMSDEVMIASEGRRRDDGSHSERRITGNYGTKVTRLVSDILSICDVGDKGIVFSQWEDMLDICEHALLENGVQLTRVVSLQQVGACSRRFREPDCSIMLLNVKNGAEGLTLVEATHVFMVEPLLNCGLDSQGTRHITYVNLYHV
jgi:E3 ubiquitin-protein ligase SHPRH